MRKSIFTFLGLTGGICAGLSTPIAIGFGIFEWVVIDVEFKFALWSGFKLWATMLLGGLSFYLAFGLPAALIK